MIFLFILVAYLFALWRMSVPLTGDEKVYLSVALEMKQRASFLTPYLFDHVNFLKPPFQYWMTLLGWDVFGFNLFGAIFPSVLALVLSAFLVKKLSRERSDLSALVFSSTLATMTYGTTAQMEIWIVLFYLAAWLFYLDQKLVLTFLTVGVMAWIKGPLYPVLFVLSVFFKAYLDHETRAMIRPKFVFSLLLGIVVGLLWYGAVSIEHYEELKSVFFGRENFGKMQTAQGSVLGLWGEFLGTLFPISFLFLGSFFDRGFKARLQANKNVWLPYALIPALFFTFFPYRVNTYLYLLTPVVAWMVIQNPELPKVFRRTVEVLVSVLTAFGLIFLYRLGVGGWLSAGLSILVALTLIAWAFAHFRFKGIEIAIASLILVNLVRIGATELGEWELSPLRAVSETPLAYRIDNDHEDIWHESGLISTALKKPIARVRSSPEEIAFVDSGGQIILSDEQSPLPEMRCLPWRRFKRRIKFPIKKLIESGLSIDDAELHRTFQICRKKT
jgi:4-amino-4-deoxy-L-arabinose transferase-like glycosyltransferase